MPVGSVGSVSIPSPHHTSLRSNTCEGGLPSLTSPLRMKLRRLSVVQLILYLMLIETVNTWMPVIARETYTQGLRNLFTKLSTEVALPVLCVRLVVRIPTDANPENMWTPLYALAKSVLPLLRLPDFCSRGQPLNMIS